MIEQPLPAGRLMEELRAALPFSAIVTKHALSATDAPGGRLVRSKQKILIEHILDGGYEGGIVCTARLPGGKEALAISITHLRFDISHPLYKEIRAYQLHRIKMLAAERNRNLNKRGSDHVPPF